MRDTARMATGPEQRVKKILVAALDEDDNPVFSTVIIGEMSVHVDSDRYETRSFRHDYVVSSWDIPTEYEIIVRGMPVQE